jgi:anaerobilin synthase
VIKTVVNAKLAGCIMKNMSNDKFTVQFEDPYLHEEYSKVKRYFDIHKRTTPFPFYPDAGKCLTEIEIVDEIRANNNLGDKRLSIYLHIPFCEGRCVFCDLYAFHVPQTKRSIIEIYLQSLEKEIRQWTHLLSLKNVFVTTIHFGGGSPFILGPEQFERVLNLLEDSFQITLDTEIAIEMTTSQITRENLQFLEKSKITRIHVGVQTLSDNIRKIIGRKESSVEVMQKLRSIISGSFIVSVDLLYGLPLQTPAIFKNDLCRFMDLGVDGFALYELQIPFPLQKVLAGNSDYAIHKDVSYGMLLEGKKILNQAGYQNVFYNHFGNKRDKNLYFTYPVRQENCLSFGAIADGQIGSLFFRHHKFKQYLKAIDQGGLGIDFGYREDDHRYLIRLCETEIMSGEITQKGIKQIVEAFGPSFKGMIDLWQAAGLICKKNESYELTGSGCWFISNMIDQARRL